MSEPPPLDLRPLPAFPNLQLRVQSVRSAAWRSEGVTGHQAGETAVWRDGSHSFFEHRQWTCSHYGGVAQWK